MHATAYVYIFSVSLLVATFYTLTESRVMCTPCSNRFDCDQPPTDMCMWGETLNTCNRRVCAKGPGERCGGTFDVLGICGEGMMCTTFLDKNVERCHGCSTLTLECYP